jgi:hypothetical protein
MFLIKKHFSATFAPSTTVIVAQLVRAPDCGSGGRRFEPGQSPDPGIHFPGFFFLSAI